MLIHLLHGVADGWISGAYSFRNYVPLPKLAAFLRARPAPYCDWGCGGDCLTVDDATVGGARACELARGLGHSVIFFVNPLQIETGMQYFFTVVDAAIDARRRDHAEYDGAIFDLSVPRERRHFRLAVKTRLMVERAEVALEGAFEVAALLGASLVAVPEHARPVTTRDVVRLRDLGVTIANHGWSHVEIRSFDANGFREHVARGREWIVMTLAQDARLYAVPFGLSDVPVEWQRDLPGPYFLVDGTRPSGALGGLGYNRVDLTSTLQGG